MRIADPQSTRKVSSPPLGDQVRRLWPALAVVILFVVGVILAVWPDPTPVLDDWIYIEAASSFSSQGIISVSPMSLAPAVFEAVWGGLAMAVFGESLFVLVISTAVLSAFAGIALWDILLSSGVGRLVSGAAVSTFLFSTVFFGLSSTSMTDAHAVSLATVAAGLFGRAIDRTRLSYGWLVLGSAVAAIGAFSRPAVALVVAGVWFVSWRRRTLLPALAATLLPALAILSQVTIARTGLLSVEGPSTLDRLAIPPASTTALALATTAIAVGVFLFPIAPLIASGLSSATRTTRVTVLGVSLSVIVLSITLDVSSPFSGNWLNVTGALPIDESTLGSRSHLIHPVMLWILTFVAICIAASALALALDRANRAPTRSSELGLWVFGMGSIAMVIVSTVAVWGRLLDRYLVALLPALVISVATRTLRSARISKPMRIATLMTSALLVVGTVALVSDGMALQRAIWSTAETATSNSPGQEIDAGAAWVGVTQGSHVTRQGVWADLIANGGEHWWRYWSPDDFQPSLVVVLNPAQSMCIVDSIDFDHITGQKTVVSSVDITCAASDQESS